MPAGADDRRRALNLQTYAARAAGLGVAAGLLEAWAVTALADALEGAVRAVRGAPDETDADPAAVADLPFKVAAAAAWAVHAGRALHGRDEEVRGTLGGPLWRLGRRDALRLRRRYRGTQGLCPERWALWKERFAAVRDCDRVDAETRARAAEAAEAMEKVENERRGELEQQQQQQQLQQQQQQQQ